MGKLRTSAGIGGIISSNVVAKSKNCVDEKAALASSCSWEIPQDHHDQSSKIPFPRNAATELPPSWKFFFLPLVHQASISPVRLSPNLSILQSPSSHIDLPEKKRNGTNMGGSLLSVGHSLPHMINHQEILALNISCHTHSVSQQRLHVDQ